MILIFGEKSMKTLIKWPGGKKNEIKYIKDLIPSFNNYVEPFLGGGALFFDLEPKNAYINDVSSDLIQFYQLLSQKQTRKNLKKILLSYCNYWNSIYNINEECFADLLVFYKKFKSEEINRNELKEEINNFLINNKKLFIENFPEDIFLDDDKYFQEINRNLYSKITRTVKLDLKKKFSDEEVKLNIETGLRSSFYMHERYKMNKISKNKLTLSKEEETANFYFVREYCYGTMFRFNQNGEFNIPYGGMSYNKKDFLEKINSIFSEDSYNLLNSAVMDNCDFEEFLNKYEFTEKDFIFFDPPYDTEFTSYDSGAFTLEDQIRLANYICSLKAKFILIIKKTDFIWSLYKDKDNIKIESFEKIYAYNIRGRNKRNVEHLVIHNIKNPQQRFDD